jgi:hypothetical protein
MPANVSRRTARLQARVPLSRPWQLTRHPSSPRLDRVGASFRKAGAAGYISVQLGIDVVKLLAPPREHPRRSWLGPEWQALELLAALPDDAGVQAVWRTLIG